jgi:3-dehydroquinate dehydratase/shikimate dehydrogenase
MSPQNQTSICVPICARTLRELESALDRAVLDADIIELRLDCLEAAELESVTQKLPEIIKTSTRPIIVTLRPKEQGGYRELTLETRLDFWKSGAAGNAGYVDVEYELVRDGYFKPSDSQPKVICSHHDFTRVPNNLDHIYKELSDSSVGVVKIAVQAQDVVDCLPIFRLIERAQSENREIIAIAMGESGVATRILGPSRGSLLTYGALAEGAGTASGQVTARELREIYRINRITRSTQIIGLVGLPTRHSISPDVHNTAFEARGVDAVYLRFEVSDLHSFMKRMVDPRSRELDWNLHGLSVTAPHKLAVMDYLDRIEPAAKEIGAVNTIIVSNDGLHGYNTDASGFLEPLLNVVGKVENLTCAVLGAGGVGRTAAWVLRQQGADVTIFARNEEKGRSLADEFGVRWSRLQAGSFREFDVVVNATPLGMPGAFQSQTVALAEQLRGTRLAYDLVYNPPETRFLREAQSAGCQTLGGMAMWVAQAKAQFKLWTGFEAPLELMQQTAERALKIK